MSATATETVTVTVDGREVQVAKGTGLVETAAAAGIEIPVFCYEPRLGPAVGACRMCLVEIEGVPKLQAGCTLTAQDGMVVRTAQSSAKAAEGQNATLEFILVNHPLDCPVCDKGGECPLQDLTFKYGPGQTRMTFPKRTFDKPIPISPTIALDRERCILCYRCTRFSSDVAEDGQLVARNRGAQSLITTFEDESYRAPFSGNVIELCPVGALTSTQYRFEARPWEIQNVPTVCGLCPVGCNISATTREGKVKRILSRNHPEVDQGWLCDKGRFAFPHLYADDRIVDPLERVRRRGFGELSWDDALDRAEALLRGAQGRIVTALSGSETLEQAYALGKLLRQGLGAHSAVLRRGDLVRARRVPGAALGDRRRARSSSWSARRRSPTARRSSSSGSSRRAATAREVVRVAEPELGEELEERVSRLGPRGPDLVGTRRRRRRAAGGARAPARPRRQARLRRVPPAGDPERPRRRRSLGGAADGDEENPEPIGLLIVSGDEAAADPAVRALAEQAEHVLAITMFHGLAVGWADLVLPGTSYLERDGSFFNLEGRVQRLRRDGDPARARRARLDREARRALRRRAVAARVRRLRGALRAALRRDVVRRGRRACAAAGPGALHRSRAGAGRSDPGRRRAAAGALPRHPRAQALPAALLRPGRRARARAPVPAPRGRDRARRRRRRAAPDRRAARRSASARTGPFARFAPASAARSRPGTVRIAEEHAADLHRDVEVVKS